jgi:hypothetical protein
MNDESSDARLEATRRFRDELAAVRVVDADDLVRYLALSARLSALGDPEPLRAWTKVAQGRVNAIEALAERAAELERQLLTLEGELLGVAVCEVQDLRLAVASESTGLLREREHDLERLGACADDVPLDDEAAAIVAGYAAIVPVPPGIRLGHVEHPVGLSSIAAAAARAPLAEPPIPLGRSGAQAGSEPGSEQRGGAEVTEEEVALCDGPAPAEALRRRFERRHGAAGELSGGIRVDAWARLHEDWSMTISIRVSGREGEAEIPRPVAVRVGTMVAEPDEDAPGMFIVELKRLTADTRSRLLVDPIVVNLSDGRRISF